MNQPQNNDTQQEPTKYEYFGTFVAGDKFDIDGFHDDTSATIELDEDGVKSLHRSIHDFLHVQEFVKKHGEEERKKPTEEELDEALLDRMISNDKTCWSKTIKACKEMVATKQKYGDDSFEATTAAIGFSYALLEFLGSYKDLFSASDQELISSKKFALYVTKRLKKEAE